MTTFEGIAVVGELGSDTFPFMRKRMNGAPRIMSGRHASKSWVEPGTCANPHLKIEMSGTQGTGMGSDVGHPPRICFGLLRLRGIRV